MRKNPLSWITFMLAFALLPARCSWGWIDSGHKVVALIAWEDLTPKTRAAVTQILKGHPLYQKDLQDNLPEGTKPEDAARYAFAYAATWPDKVRGQNHPMHAAYNHPQWHYIDIPFDDGVETPPQKDQGEGPHNAVEALTQCSAELKNPQAAADKRAIDLCWVIHLVGDIHQPLHTVSLYSKQYPKGDQGGNAELVLRDPPYPDSMANLHLVWDSLPGDYKSEFIDQYIAQGVHSDPQFSRAKMKSLLGTTDFMAWAKESNALAVEDAYLNGHLDTAVAPKGRSGAAPDKIPGLPPGYMAKAELVAMHQVGLAGYRLADMLNEMFGK
ncbi:MAG TPA: S1/P1 nuclease [Tepidisphaeraceae bacterium]|nr:S1/P1 nuclease [Tepidisphaeraceae bacterium]